MAEAHVNHVIGTMRKVADAHDAHDADARASVIVIHRETLAEVIARAKGEQPKGSAK